LQGYAAQHQLLRGQDGPEFKDTKGAEQDGLTLCQWIWMRPSPLRCASRGWSPFANDWPANHRASFPSGDPWQTAVLRPPLPAETFGGG